MALLDQSSWSTPIWRRFPEPINKTVNPSWQSLNVADNELEDGRIADAAVDVLTEVRDRQFFSPSVLTNRTYRFMPQANILTYIPLKFSLYLLIHISPKTPRDIASNPKGLKGYQDISNYPPFSDEKTLALIRAYAATTSYMDAQVGRVLNQLDMLGLTENTVCGFSGGTMDFISENTGFGGKTRFSRFPSVRR